MVSASSGFMKAVCFDAPGGADVLYLSDVQRPLPDVGEVLIEVHFSGVNRPDVLQRLGLYPAPPNANPRLGLEVSGQIVQVGEGVDPALIGTNVMALTNGGGYAEYVAVPYGQCLPVPEGLTLAEAASLPEVYFTVWQNLVVKGNLSRGQHVLVHGGSSGIGSAAIQLAKSLGAVVHVTVGSEPKAQYCKALGADHVYLYKTDNWSDLALKNSPGGVDLVLDMVAGDYLSLDLACTKEGGAIIVIALLGGRFAKIDAAQLMMKQVVLTGSTLRPRSSEFKASLATQLGAFIEKRFSSGELKSVVSKVFNLNNANEAHQLLESGSSVGKIVLKVKE